MKKILKGLFVIGLVGALMVGEFLVITKNISITVDEQDRHIDGLSYVTILGKDFKIKVQHNHEFF